MTGYSVIISVFVICVSFAMTMTNEVNLLWAAAYGRNLVDYNITAPITYSEISGTSMSDINSTYQNMTRYDKPADVTSDYGFFQGLSATRIFINTLFNSVYGFPQFLTHFGMPSLLVAPMAVLLLASHILTLFYFITGRGI